MPYRTTDKTEATEIVIIDSQMNYRGKLDTYGIISQDYREKQSVLPYTVPTNIKKQEQVMDVQVAVLLFHSIKVRESLPFSLTIQPIQHTRIIFVNIQNARIENIHFLIGFQPAYLTFSNIQQVVC